MRARIRRAFDLVSAAAAVSPGIFVAGGLLACDVEERVAPVPTVDPSACRPTPFVPVPADTCGAYVHLPCGLPPDIKPVSGPGCYFSIPDCNRICNEIYFSCHATEPHCDAQGKVLPGEGGAVDVDCVECFGNSGRAFAGLVPAEAARTDDRIARGLARMAWLEAASVRAFARLGRDLARVGAPAELRRSVARARRDEARHARVAGAAARRRGAIVPRVREASRREPSREGIARENAVEGCVGETLSALTLAWARSRARAIDLRAVFAEVAEDELEHACLSFEVHAWLMEGLSASARARVRAAGRAALERSLSSPALVGLAARPRAMIGGALASLVEAAFSASPRARTRPCSAT